MYTASASWISWFAAFLSFIAIIVNDLSLDLGLKQNYDK